ncbi:MAG: vanadium-dependent haloperoxidase [Planctomycetota bacterium]|nr:vanadium-dependent haloperoxidase [Planctomycetota bacterium]
MSTHIQRALSSLAIASLSFLGTACSGGSNDDPAPGLSSSAAASTYDSEVALQWHELFYMRVKATGVNPPAASRIFGYVGVTLYESIVPGMTGYQTLQGQLNGLPAGTLPAPVNAPHHWPTVANRALAVIGASFFSTSTSEINALEEQFSTQFEAAQPADVIARSVAHGEAVANAILIWAAADGIAAQAACGSAFVPPVLPAAGGWTPVSPATGVGLLPCWGNLRTFAVDDTSECAPIGPPAYSTATTSAWYAQALLVYNTTGDAGANLTSDQIALASYWADGATATGTPPGHWIAITCQMCGELPLALDRGAEAFARVGIAVADAFTTCWRAKYIGYLERPIAYIRTNIDAAWDPLLGTPNFPTYTSGHSSQSGAAAVVLMDMLGPIAFTDTCHTRLNPELTFANRTFQNFAAAAAEAAQSRLYGGIHYAFDNVDGSDSGECVGNIINANVHFRTP